MRKFTKFTQPSTNPLTFLPGEAQTLPRIKTTPVIFKIQIPIRVAKTLNQMLTTTDKFEHILN